MGQTAIQFCNDSPNDLSVWLEPWAEEFAIPRRGEMTLEIESDQGVPPEPELVTTDHGITVYAEGGTLVRVLINGIINESASAVVKFPDLGKLSSKGFVELVFGGFAEARPHGAPAPRRRNWFQRLFSARY